jgi:glutamate racemase
MGARLGIVDWGIGGLGVLRLLDARLPALPVTYWSDSGTEPYGLQRPADLAARLRTVIDALADDHGCTEVVLACNAASTVATRIGATPVPVEGIIAHGIAAVRPGARSVGVVGGRRTIASGAYRRGLARSGRTVRSRVAQPLSAHIEAGHTGSPAFLADLERVIAPLRGVDTLVLACTHYPAATPWFAESLPATELVDPADAMVAAIAGRHRESRRPRRPDRTYVTTGDPRQFRRTAALAWGLGIDHVTRERV